MKPTPKFKDLHSRFHVYQKQTILDALHQYKGDDFEKANFAFKDLSEKQLNENYGQSGLTPRQILKDYEQHKIKVERAIFWVTGCTHVREL